MWLHNTSRSFLSNRAKPPEILSIASDSSAREVALRWVRSVRVRVTLQARPPSGKARSGVHRSEEHTSELQSLMRISYAVFCLNKKIRPQRTKQRTQIYIHVHRK